MSISNIFSIALAAAFPFSSYAGQTKEVEPPKSQLTRQETRYLNSLILRCDEQGDGQACYRYSEVLRDLDPVKNDRLATKYMRRACQLAFTRACAHKSAPKEFKVENGPDGKTKSCSESFVTATSVEAAPLPDGQLGYVITKLDKGSALEKAGAKVGDVITKLNGSELHSPDDVVKALESGGAALEVNRGGHPIPIAATCK